MSEAASVTERPQAGERPFPWFCPRCRRQEVWRETIAYQCQRDLRGKPIIIAIANLAVPKCRNCDELVFDYSAEKQINRACAAHTHLADGRNGAQMASPASEKQEQG